MPISGPSEGNCCCLDAEPSIGGKGCGIGRRPYTGPRLLLCGQVSGRRHEPLDPRSPPIEKVTDVASGGSGAVNHHEAPWLAPVTSVTPRSGTTVASGRSAGPRPINHHVPSTSTEAAVGS